MNLAARKKDRALADLVCDIPERGFHRSKTGANVTFVLDDWL